MLFGEAFISLMPTLDQGATSKIAVEAGRVGQRAGQALSDSFSRAAKLPEVAVKVATQAAERSIDAFKLKLAAIRDKVVNLDVDATKAKIEIGNLTKETRALASGFIALGPAAIPVLAAVTTTAIGTGSAIAAAAAPLAIFGAAVGSAFADVKEQSDKIDTMKTKVLQLDEQIAAYKATGQSTEALEKQRAATLDKINAAYTSMSPNVHRAADAYAGLKGAWQGFLETNSTAVYGFLVKGMDTLASSIGKLQPLMDIGSAAADRLLTKFQGFADGGGLERFVAYLSKNAGPALDNLGKIAGNVGVFLSSLFKGTMQDGQSFLAMLAEGSEKLAAWSTNGGLQAFLDYMRENGPRVGGLLLDLASAAMKIAEAVTPLAPLTLAVAAGLAALIDAIPVDVLTTIVGLFVAYNVALVAYNLYTGIANAATKVWAATQWLLNAAMTANPIGIVVVAIAALVAAIVLAYKNSETFRNIVQAVWGAIKVAIAAVADWFTKTVWPALKSALDAIGQAFSWLNTNVIQPVWRGIQSAIEVAWSVIKVLFAAGEAYVRALGAVFMWLWRNVIEPVWSGIKVAIQVAWLPIRLIFGTIEIAVRAMALVFQWFYTSVIVPVWTAIRTAISAAWTWLRDTIFNPLIAFVRGVLSAAWTFYSGLVSSVWTAIRNAVSAAWSWVRDNVLNPLIVFVRGTLVNAWETAKSGITSAWNAIKSPLQTTWNWIKDNVFTPLSNFITKTIPDAFTKGVSAVKSAWEKVQAAASAPVKFVVNTVINEGIIKGFNTVSGFVNGPHIDPIKLPFATGGILPGYTPGRDVHRFVSPTGGMLDLSGGEAIMRPEFTRAVGSAFINAGNAAARSGGVGGVRDFLTGFLKHGDNPQYANGGILAFKGGGILGGIVDGIKGAWDAFTNPVDTFKKVVGGLVGGITGGRLGDVLKGTANKLIDSVAAWITSKFEASGQGMGSAGGPGNWSAMWNWVKTRFPQAQLFSGLRNSTTLSGNKSLHASGRAIDISPIRAISSAIISTFGKNITELISPWKADHVWHGQRPHDYGYALDAQHGVYGSNSHIHWAMKLGGILKRIGIFDTGGWLKSGGAAINMSGRPEAVLTAEESAGLKALGLDTLADKIDELIEAVREVAPGVGGYIRGSGKSLTMKARSV